MLFLLCAFFDSASHILKESIVRSQPLEQEEFIFKISVSQFIVGLVITPAILMISKYFEDYGSSEMGLY